MPVRRPLPLPGRREDPCGVHRRQAGTSREEQRLPIDVLTASEVERAAERNGRDHALGRFPVLPATDFLDTPLSAGASLARIPFDPNPVASSTCRQQPCPNQIAQISTWRKNSPRRPPLPSHFFCLAQKSIDRLRRIDHTGTWTNEHICPRSRLTPVGALLLRRSLTIWFQPVGPACQHRDRNHAANHPTFPPRSAGQR